MRVSININTNGDPRKYLDTARTVISTALTGQSVDGSLDSLNVRVDRSGRFYAYAFVKQLIVLADYAEIV